MEAMAVGVPVVVSDIPANLELVEHENSGLVFPLGKGPEITKMLKCVLTDEELSGRLAQAAQKKIEDRHSIQKLVDNHKELYSRLTGG